MDRDSQEIECWKQLALLSERFHQDFNGRSKRAICNVWILIYPIIQSEPDVFEWRLEQYEFNACTWGLKVHIRADMPTLMVWGHFQVKSQKCLEDLQLTATAKLPWNLIFHPNHTDVHTLDPAGWLICGQMTRQNHQILTRTSQPQCCAACWSCS